MNNNLPTNPYATYGTNQNWANAYSGYSPCYQPMNQNRAATSVPGVPAGSSLAGSTTTTAPDIPGLPPLERSYIENILRLNLGKVATIYMTFENNSQWNAKIFQGVLEAAGRDHIVIKDPKSNKHYLLLMINLDYVTFDEELTYDLPFGR